MYQISLSKKLLFLKYNDNIIIEYISFKALISFYKIDITPYISHFIGFIIYLFILNFFIKVYIIIQNNKILVIYFFIELLEKKINISLKSFVESFTSY